MSDPLPREEIERLSEERLRHMQQRLPMDSGLFYVTQTEYRALLTLALDYPTVVQERDGLLASVHGASKALNAAEDRAEAAEQRVRVLEETLRKAIWWLKSLGSHEAHYVKAAEAALQSAPTSPPVRAEAVVEAPTDRRIEWWIQRVIGDVCELPDRTSPEDQPEMMLITGEELDGILRNNLPLIEAALSQQERTGG